MVLVVLALLLMLVGGGVVVFAEAVRAGLRKPSWGGALGWLGLLAISAGALFWRVRGVPHHHIMYVDEPWYEEAAHNLLRRGALVLCEETPGGEACEPYPKSAGWPVILAIAFKLLGVREAVAFQTSAVLGALAAPLAAAVTRLAGGRWHHAWLAAAILAVHPLHVLWSGTAETNTASTALLLAGLAGVLSRGRDRSLAGALLAAGGLGVAAAVRPELWLAFLPTLALTVWWWRKQPPFWQGGVIILIGAVLGALPGYAARSIYLVHSKGALFEWANVQENLQLWLTNQGEAGWLSGALVAAAMLAVPVAIWRRQWAPAALLGATAVFVGAFAIFYYPPEGFYARTMLGAVVAGVPLAVLLLPGTRACGLLWAGRALALGGIVLCVQLARSSAETLQRVPGTQRSETELPDLTREVAWPANAIVLAEWPTVLAATTELRVMSTSKALAGGAGQLLKQAQSQPTYLLCDMFCETGFQGGIDTSACGRLLGLADLEEVRTTPGGARNYGVFRVLGPATPGRPRAACPCHGPRCG
jgi:hypothetical protein